MSEDRLIPFFIQLAFMLTAALLCGAAARRFGQPSVLGEIIGGILIGPSVLGQVVPGFHDLLFETGEQCHLMMNALLNLGMLFFLFIAGMEIDFSTVRRTAGASLLISALGIAVPFALGASSVMLLPWIWMAPTQETGLFAVFVGAAMSISSLPVIIRILMDLGLTRSREGQITISSAVINDLLGWILFIYVLGTLSPSDAVNPLSALLRVLAFGAAVLLAGALLGRFFTGLARRLGGEAGNLLSMISILILGAAALASECGVHPIFGAFLIGASLGSVLRHNHCVETVITQFAVSFFAPLYFVSVGMKLDFSRSFDPLLVLLVVAVSFTGKLLGAGGGALLSGMRPGPSALVAFGLNARGAMEIILAGVALSASVIDERIFLALVVMAILTTLVSAPAIRYFSRNAGTEAG